MKRFLKFITDLLSAVPLLMLGNAVILWQIGHDVNAGIKIIFLFILIGYYLCSLFLPERKQADSHKLAMLSHGIRLIRQGCICSVIQIPLAVWESEVSMKQVISAVMLSEYWKTGLNLVIFLVMLAGLFLGGVLRTVVSSRQVRPLWYLLLLLFWWMPVINLILFRHIGKIARREFYFERAKAELDISREESQICRTKYPILMVHGIFFRDWQLFNYWGRIPAELQKNGAKVFYGNQQSAQSIAKSAEELHAQIHQILEQTGAEKINIIAHSKGGLDSRYALAKLGDAPYAASLTTISTPHDGCAWVDDVLKKMPVSIQNWLDRKYADIFHVLGDKDPAFLEGVRDLTASHGREFNAECPVPDGIFCQCYMSEMKKAYSAPFPLWAGYLCIQHHEPFAKNDGLVPTEAAALSGKPFKVLKSSETRGISPYALT